MLELDQDYVGRDFTMSIKAFNPNLLDGGLTGIVIGQYLQSVTKSLSLGLEAVWQRPYMNAAPEAQISYGARYKGAGWVASAGIQAAGALQLTYWRKLAERVEAGVESQLKLLDAPMIGIRREGVTTIGAKYDFRGSTMRAQVDTTGRLGCLLEKRVAPMVTLAFSGEMDHFKVSTYLTSLSFSLSFIMILMRVTLEPSKGWDIRIYRECFRRSYGPATNRSIHIDTFLNRPKMTCKSECGILPPHVHKFAALHLHFLPWIFSICDTIIQVLRMEKDVHNVQGIS